MLSAICKYSSPRFWRRHNSIVRAPAERSMLSPAKRAQAINEQGKENAATAPTQVQPLQGPVHGQSVGKMLGCRRRQKVVLQVQHAQAHVLLNAPKEEEEEEEEEEEKKMVKKEEDRRTRGKRRGERRGKKEKREEESERDTKW